MLVLCRRTRESLIIGDEVTVTVLSVKGNQVRFGLNAPLDIPIDREEIYKRNRRRVLELTAPESRSEPPLPIEESPQPTGVPYRERLRLRRLGNR